MSLNGSLVHGCRDSVCWYALNAGLTVRPAPNISASFGPAFRNDPTGSWYITSQPDTTATAMYGARYVFGKLRQREFSMNTRLNVTFTPTLTLELYLQPLISAAGFTRLHEYSRPRSLDRTYYGVNGGTDSVHADGSHTIDPDGPAGPAQPFTIGNPDFNRRSLRGNAVLRWEFRPGSTIFLVWTQSRENTGPEGDFRLGRDARELLGARPDNIFLVKVSYWMGF